MGLKVLIRPDTGKLWIMGTVTPAGAFRGYRVRKRAGTDDLAEAEKEAAAIASRICVEFRRKARTAMPPRVPWLTSLPASGQKQKFVRRSYGHASPGSRSTAVMASLYVLTGAGLVKIGVAKSVDRRLADVRAQSPVPIDLAASFPIRLDVVGWAEHLAHLTLADCHSHAEWFRCDPNKAIAVANCAVARASAIPLGWLSRGFVPESYPVAAEHRFELLAPADAVLAAKVARNIGQTLNVRPEYRSS